MADIDEFSAYRAARGSSARLPAREGRRSWLACRIRESPTFAVDAGAPSYLKTAATDFEASDMPVHATIAAMVVCSPAPPAPPAPPRPTRLLDRLGVRNLERLAAVFAPGDFSPR